MCAPKLQEQKSKGANTEIGAPRENFSEWALGIGPWALRAIREWR
jgi:hypothetical protein